MKVPVGISNRHVHLTKEVYYKLFEEDMSVKRNLKQPRQFAANQTVSLKANDKIIENVRLIGPFRDYNQVEILEEDAKYFGLKAFPRNSGDLAGSPGITLCGPKGQTYLNNCVIIANRHVHLPAKLSNGFKDNSIVKVVTKKGKELGNVHIKISDNYALEFHINKDDALKNEIENDEEVTIC